MRVVDGPGPRSSRDGAPARAAAGRAASLSRRLRVRRLAARRGAGRLVPRGARGGAVGRLLENLPEGRTVLHAVPVGKGDSDIDHVGIGRGGESSINTKNHAGHQVWVAGRTFLVNGQKQPHLRKRRARSPATEPSTQRCRRLPRRRDRGGGSRGPDHRESDPSRSSSSPPASWSAGCSSARRLWFHSTYGHSSTSPADPATWRASPTPGAEPAAVLSSFSALDRQVRRARRTRRTWACGLLGAGGLVAVTSGPSLPRPSSRDWSPDAEPLDRLLPAAPPGAGAPFTAQAAASAGGPRPLQNGSSRLPLGVAGGPHRGPRRPMASSLRPKRTLEAHDLDAFLVAFRSQHELDDLVLPAARAAMSCAVDQGITGLGSSRGLVQGDAEDTAVREDREGAVSWIQIARFQMHCAIAVRPVHKLTRAVERACAQPRHLLAWVASPGVV